MITKIFVDGFKSLSKFELVLNQGLNVLVGPNGTGKTNVVSFFEFLAHIVETNPAEATSFFGGAGAILRRTSDSHCPTISAKAFGSFAFDPEDVFQPKAKSQNKYAFYEFSFTLQYLGPIDPVVFAKQQFKLKLVKDFIGHDKIESELKDWDLDMEMTLDSQALKPIIAIKKITTSMGSFMPFFPSGTKKEQQSEQLQQFLTTFFSANLAIPTGLARLNPPLRSIAADIAGGQAYNIIPSRVRLPEDSAKPPGIASDGSGLASTLYFLNRKVPNSPNFPLFQIFAPVRQQSLKTPSIENLVKYFQLANDTIKQLIIHVDNYSNQIQVKFKVESGDYKAEIPLSLMSDGTLKWITLLTAALTAQSVFSIEEPENYLHPNMQSKCISFLRDILFQENKNVCALITTHSETVLNSCLPNELVIVTLNNGETQASRCKDEATISEEIAKTGFGLGYYYITNGL